jgi:hypothetical protein
VLQPLALLVGSIFLLVLTGDLSDPLAGVGIILYSVLFFGSLQAFAIVPAAVMAVRRGRIPFARGLLLCGIVLALLNIVLWMTVFREIGRPPIY